MYKRVITALLVAFAIFNAFALEANAASLQNRLKGYFLLSVEDHGKLWFVDPTEGTRTYVPDAKATWNLIKGQMIGITNADLKKLPKPGEAPSDVALLNRLKGKFLLAVENHGEIWFVNPHTGYRHYLGVGEDTYFEVRYVALGITMSDLGQIPVAGQSSIDKQAQNTEQSTLDSIKSTVKNYTPTDGELAWEFASTLWNGYEGYQRDHQHYPELYWMEYGFGYNQPIYLNEKGFTLDPSTQNLTYWEWDTFSTEFYATYYKLVDFSVDSLGYATLRVTLPNEVQTATQGTLAPGNYYFFSTLGFLTENEYRNRANEIEELAAYEYDFNKIKSNLGSVEYTNSQMAWLFVNSYWDGLKKFDKANGYYLDKQWFEGVFQYGLPTYLTKNGITLDRPANEDEIFMEWSHYTDEFFKFYFDHFDYFIDSRGDANFKFDLAKPYAPDGVGFLEAGTYYFNERHGFLTSAQYQVLGDPYLLKSIEDVDVNEEAERVMNIILDLQEGLLEYSTVIWGGYPEVYGNSIYLGEGSHLRLTSWYGFTDKRTNVGDVIISRIPSAAPTTRIEYDSRLGGKSYIIRFELLGSVRIGQTDYTSGKYEMTPELGIKKVLNLTGDIAQSL